MFSLYTLIFVVAIALTAGCVLGVVLSRYTSPQEQKARMLRNQLQQTEERLTAYQQKVNEHFSETAKRVKKLSQSYCDVHEHLASEALKLANVDISRELLNNTINDDKLLRDIPINEEDFQPPKDWAPKLPGSENTLSESFGLEKDFSEQTTDNSSQTKTG